MLGEAASAWGNPAKDSWYRDYGFMIVDNSQSGEYGAGFIDADKATRLEVTEDGGCALGQYDYNMWGGTVTIGFKPLNGCRNVQMYPGYIHTWTSTGITSLGAGPWSFSISWDNPGNSWEKSESGPSAYVCA